MNLLVLALLSAAVPSAYGTVQDLDLEEDPSGGQFCWKESYGRGIGRSPSQAALAALGEAALAVQTAQQISATMMKM